MHLDRKHPIDGAELEVNLLNHSQIQGAINFRGLVGGWQQFSECALVLP